MKMIRLLVKQDLFNRKEPMAKMALRIAPAYQGRGFATEASKAIIDFCFTHTELQRIWTDVDTRTIHIPLTSRVRGWMRKNIESSEPFGLCYGV